MTLSLLVPALLSTQLSAQVQLQGPRNSADAFSGVVYGPIDQNDTLWRIATRYKQNSEFSVYQTMLAIYQLNPQAFENRNFNTMVNGATLQLPSDQFIARMDVQRARMKAEADDRAFGRPNSVQSEEVLQQVAAENAEPEIPLVNQEDLASTKAELQQQLNSLNRSQLSKVDEVKEQVVNSITNVEALLEENRRLYERIDQVNTDISDLRDKVEGEVQDQIDQQLALQKEIIELVKQAEQREIARESESFFNTLANPVVAISLSSVFTIGLLSIIGFWLLRKPKQISESPVSTAKVNSDEDIVDDELVIGEMDDDDAEALMAALDQDMGGDDILSSDLEDGLDELGVGDDFADADDMLVPDEKDEKKSGAVEEDVSFDTDAISLDDEDFDNQEIDLNPKEEAQSSEPAQAKTEVVEDLTSDLDLDNFDVQDDDDVNESEADVAANLAEKAGTAADDLDQPNETQIDSTDSTEDTNDSSPEEAQESDLPEETEETEEIEETSTSQGNKLATPVGDGPPEGVLIDESADIDEEAIEQIENTINETTEQFEKLSEELLTDLENASDEEEDDVALPPETDAPAPIDSLDSNTATETNADSATGADTKVNDVSESSEDITTDTDSIAKDADDLADEILADLEDEQASEELDSLLDEISEELSEEAVDASESNGEKEPIPSSDAENEDDDNADVDLSDVSQDELAEASSADVTDTQESAQELDPENSIDLDLDDTQASAEETQSELNDALLSELDDDDEGEDDLDALLEEFSEGVESDSSSVDDAGIIAQSNTLDNTESLMDDIPSLGEIDEPTPAQQNDTEQETRADDAVESSAEEQGTGEDIDNILDDEDDVLADLPGLDDWLGDDDLAGELEDITQDDDIDSELNVLADIEGADFEDLLSEIDAENKDSDEQLEQELAGDTENETSDISDAAKTELSDAGLDIDTLMQEESDVDDFVNVDDLLAQSESLTPLEDEDVTLDLDKSLERMQKERPAQSLNESDSESSTEDDAFANQASNLDLAQVYIDMDDVEAATEVLDEIVSQGSPEQVSEAKELLQQITNK